MDLAFLHDSTIFDDSTIDRMLGQLEILLEEFLKKPEARLDQLSLLTADEKQHIQLTWNKPSHSVSGIHTLFEAQVERTPHAPAVTCGDRSISYQELNRRANRVARALQKFRGLRRSPGRPLCRAFGGCPRGPLRYSQSRGWVCSPGSILSRSPPSAHAGGCASFYRGHAGAPP